VPKECVLYNVEKRKRGHGKMETERLILRPWTEADAEELFLLARDEHVEPPCGWNPHKDLEESKTVLKNLLMNDFTFAIELKSTGKVIGDIAVMPFGESRYSKDEDQAEIGFWLGYEYWGNGYMPESCKRMIEYAFDRSDLRELLCVHDITNHNSKRVQEKCGFEYDRTEVVVSKRTGKEETKIVNHILREG